MTMRWKRSMCVPMAWATAALIGSACDTHTTTPPLCAARRRSIAETIRTCISLKLSPPGNLNVEGARITVPHSGNFINFLSSSPVHSPKSHSSKPLSMRTRRPFALAIGAAVSRARSNGDAYTASTWLSAAIRSAAAVAWAWPASARCRPAARPGRTFPVVGVSPWRTSKNSVDDGGACFALAISRLQLSVDSVDSLPHLAADVGECRHCPRLVAWREQVADEKRAAFRDQQYWGRGVPGFGDPRATVLILGLAPAAHGANRTGRVFTGDRSGDFLYRAMNRVGMANQPTSVSIDDGLTLDGAWVTAVVKCETPRNKPLPEERVACHGFLERELQLLDNLRVVVCLGA